MTQLSGLIEDLHTVIMLEYTHPPVQHLLHEATDTLAIARAPKRKSSYLPLILGQPYSEARTRICGSDSRTTPDT